MTSCVDPVPLTDEDCKIWWHVRARFGVYPHAHIELDASYADRRDAARMLQRQRTCTLKYRDGEWTSGSGQTPRSWWCLPL